MSEVTQTVANDANAIPKGDAAAGESAQKDIDNTVSELDELLKEWDQPNGEQADELAGKEAEAEKSDKAPSFSESLKEVVDHVRSQKIESEKAQKERDYEKAQKDLSETVKSIKGDLQIPDKMIRGYLIERANEDQRIARAWQNRASKPQDWAKVEKALKAEITKELQIKEDPKVTQAREQIAGAIQSAQSSTTGDLSGKKLSEMSDQEFERYKQQFISG